MNVDSENMSSEEREDFWQNLKEEWEKMAREDDLEEHPWLSEFNSSSLEPFKVGLWLTVMFVSLCVHMFWDIHCLSFLVSNYLSLTSALTFSRIFEIIIIIKPFRELEGVF